MSKASELRALRYGRSVDAPINYHHRTGDSEGESGNMLDLYAQEKSVEEVIFEEEDELAKVRFLKGFQGYLRKVFSRTEREFLRRLMSGNERLQDVGRGMGVDWFKFMQSIQRKAYKNTKPLLKLSEVTGWSRAEEFTTMIMRRLALLDEGAELEDLLPKAANRAKVREALKAAKAISKAEKKAYQLAYKSKWKQDNRDKVLAEQKKYRETHKDEIKERLEAYRKKHGKELAIKNKIYRENRREEEAARHKAYVEKNREKVNRYRSDYQKRNRDKINARRRENRKNNIEKSREKDRLYKRVYSARKKAEREAAKVAQS